MTERARIVEINDTVTTLESDKGDGCATCSSLFCSTKPRTYKATLPSDISATVGDYVEVFVPPMKSMAVGFAVLIVPLLLFVAGYYAVASTGSEPLQVAGGFGGLIVGFAGVAFLGRNHKPELPRIVSVYTEPQLQPVNFGS